MTGTRTKNSPGGSLERGQAQIKSDPLAQRTKGIKEQEDSLRADWGGRLVPLCHELAEPMILILPQTRS